MPHSKNNFFSGFTLIEALVLIFIFSIITLTFYNVISLGTRYIIFSKNRLGAIAVANEKMEIIRNLKYEDVGIVGGACAGNIPQDEDISENGKNYHVHTLAAYIDDSFDGTLGGSPNDVAYKDYKTVKIVVSWNDGGADEGDVTLASRFVPRGLEVASTGDGILSINVVSDQAGGLPVSQASVHIVNTDVGINQTIQTDNNGNITLVGAKESIQRYQITLTKSGYETVNTLIPYPDTPYNPIDIHASVISGELNVVSIIQNKTGNINVKVEDYLGEAIPEADIILKGGRKLGTTANALAEPVYGPDILGGTNADGEKKFESLSPGQYDLDFVMTDYVLIGVDRLDPFLLASEETIDINARMAPVNSTGLLVSVFKDSDSSQLSGASVKLKNESFTYEQTIETEIDGRVFFPVSDTPIFQAGTYDLTISKSGFEEIKKEVVINENLIQNEEILMIEN